VPLSHPTQLALQNEAREVREAALSVATRQEKLEAALLLAKEKEKMWTEKVRV
jgi:hypothetical protein